MRLKKERYLLLKWWHSLAWQVLLFASIFVGMQGCTANDEGELLAPISWLTLEIGSRKVGERYKALVVGSEPKQTLYISSIEGFDSIYKEGYRYKIKVKQVTSRKSGLSEYILEKILKKVPDSNRDDGGG